MPIDPSTLESFDGKDVVLHRIKEDGSVEELTGKIDGASEFGVAFKEKGKRDVVLVEPKDIEEIDVAAVKPKSLPQKKLKPIDNKAVRQHLLDRHGYGRKHVNAMSDEDAVAEHDSVDHTDLGHRHMTPEELAKADEKKASESSDSE